MDADSLARELAHLISSYLSGELDFGSFEQAFVSLTWDAHRLGDASLDEAVKDIEHALVQSRVHVFGEAEFRRWLADALHRLVIRA
uniref:Uncharacterized protein n=1 Tax=Thermorudis peleae TaxID=1382356 RepID=A0A831X6S6_9BACT